MAGLDDASITKLSSRQRKRSLSSAYPRNGHRPSFGVAQFLQPSGYRIIPVNPNESEVLGEKCYARLENIPEKIDIVDIFRRSVSASG